MALLSNITPVIQNATTAATPTATGTQINPWDALQNIPKIDPQPTPSQTTNPNLPSNYQEARAAYEAQRSPTAAYFQAFSKDQFGNMWGSSEASAFDDFYNKNYGTQPVTNQSDFGLGPNPALDAMITQSRQIMQGSPTQVPSTWEDYLAQQGPVMTMDVKPWQQGEYAGMDAKTAYETWAAKENANPSMRYIGTPQPAPTGGLSSIVPPANNGVSYGTTYTNPITSTNTVNFNASNSGGGMDLINATAAKDPTQRTEANVAGYAQPYVSDLLSSTQAYVDAGTPAYTGQLTAGYSPLQQQAWQGLSSLTLPTGMDQAQQNLQKIQGDIQNLSYTPTTFTDAYKAPTAYTPTTFTNQFTAPTSYTPTTVTSGTFGAQEAQQYMNPYIQASLNPQLTEARRQAEIERQADQARLTQAGAFGGSRQAILEAERERNLATNLANITGQGYNTAYQQAQQQYNADQARNLQAQQANIQQAQFAAQQGMTAAQLQAQYGLSAQQANELARQYGYTQGMTQAQQAAQSKQFQEQQQQAANQFGATYGLQGLQAATSANQALSNAAAQEAQYGLANLQALSTAGAQQQTLDQAALNAQYNEFLRQIKSPQELLKFQKDVLTGLPISGTTTYGQIPGLLQQAAGGIGGALDLITKAKAAGLDSSTISNLLKKFNASGDNTTVTELPNTAVDGEEAYGWRYFSDGTAISPEGIYYYQGTEVFNPGPEELSGGYDDTVEP